MDHYRTLMVDHDVDADILAVVYRQLARRYHPDVQSRTGSVTLMRQINAAYHVLRDPELRAAYDLTLDDTQPAELPVDAHSFTWIEADE